MAVARKPNRVKPADAQISAAHAEALVWPICHELIPPL
jgi:hypothetical protein